MHTGLYKHFEEGERVHEIAYKHKLEAAADILESESASSQLAVSARHRDGHAQDS